MLSEDIAIPATHFVFEVGGGDLAAFLLYLAMRAPAYEPLFENGSALYLPSYALGGATESVTVRAKYGDYLLPYFVSPEGLQPLQTKCRCDEVSPS